MHDDPIPESSPKNEPVCMYCETSPATTTVDGCELCDEHALELHDLIAGTVGGKLAEISSELGRIWQAAWQDFLRGHADEADR